VNGSLFQFTVRRESRQLTLFKGAESMSDQHVDASFVEKIPHLDRLGNVVPEGYDYSRKLVTPGQDLSLLRAYLKWYEIRPPEVEISQAQVAESRAFVEAEVERLKIEDELGFVFLHRAGPVLLLLLTTWRNTNEMWLSAYAKDLAQAGGYHPLLFERIHRGTYCVWELGPIWHERNAWVRFLSSKRDEQAKLAYVNDRFSGLV
jgi:hypothetical protein